MAVKTSIKANTVCNLLNDLVKAGMAPPHKPGKKPGLQPVWDKDLCARCALCYLYCPDAAISRQDDGFFDAEMDLCKSCGICHRECWFGAISMQEVD